MRDHHQLPAASRYTLPPRGSAQSVMADARWCSRPILQRVRNDWNSRLATEAGQSSNLKLFLKNLVHDVCEKCVRHPRRATSSGV